MDSNFCYKDDNRDRYIFYEYIDKYLRYDSFCNNDSKCQEYKTSCNFVGTPIEGDKDLVNICTKFKYLINNILITTNSTDSKLDEVHFEYINYWLNDQLNINNQIICPKDFLQHMRTKDNRNNTLRQLDRKLDYIERDELINMKTLFYMYKHYYDIKKVIEDDYPIESTAMKYAKYCVERYGDLEDECIGRSTQFCNALRIFKSKYEKIDLKNHNIEEWTKKELPLLSKYERVQTKAIVPLVSVSSSLSQDTKISEQIIDYTGTRVVDLGTTYESTEASEKGSVPSAPVNLHTTNEISGLMIDQQKMPLEEGKQIETKSEDGFDTSTNKIIGTSISTVGVSSLFFLFYKFTSLGSRFRSQNKSKKYIRNNFDHQSHNFLDTSEYQYTPEENMSYNISYNSV
ncbi:Plasmodium vivax Vir protein, putative [Plasmodium vivax]|nr:Plasmodium vivax Vir protein, putative [Plasmodium vivax]